MDFFRAVWSFKRLWGYVGFRVFGVEGLGFRVQSSETKSVYRLGGSGIGLRGCLRLLQGIYMPNVHVLVSLTLQVAVWVIRISYIGGSLRTHSKLLFLDFASGDYIKAPLT